MKLEPKDDSARRERGFTSIQMGKVEQGTADLQWFLARHPEDPTVHYELGLAMLKDEPAKALVHLDKALALKPDFAAAHSIRGSLYYQAGKFNEALADLEAAAKLQPDDAVALDRLGQTYTALDRAPDAVRVLQRAAELAPADSKTVFHYARALADAGQAAESKVAMDRFRQLGPPSSRAVPGGLVDYLSLTPEQQHADYRARVEKAAKSNPADAATQVEFLELLVEDGANERAAATAQHVATLPAGASVLADAGKVLLEFGQYATAKPLLEKAGATADVRLDLSLTAFYSSGAKEGLQQLDRIPLPDRSGDYGLARALMIAADGRSEEALVLVQQAMRRAPVRFDLYRAATAFLVRGGHAADALTLLGQASQSLPKSREVSLLRATTLHLAGRTSDAERLLSELQGRWPEWQAVWVARGVLLESRGRFDEAGRALGTAMALGAHSPAAYFYLAESGLRAASPRLDEVEKAVQQAVRMAPEDPWILDLADRVAIARRDYRAAAERLQQAIGLRPMWSHAHTSLAEAYEALGRKAEAQAESERAKEPEQGSAAGDAAPFAAALFLDKSSRNW